MFVVWCVKAVFTDAGGVGVRVAVSVGMPSGKPSGVLVAVQGGEGRCPGPIGEAIGDFHI
jgi:hypothetical protein